MGAAAALELAAVVACRIRVLAVVLSRAFGFPSFRLGFYRRFRFCRFGRTFPLTNRSFERPSPRQFCFVHVRHLLGLFTMLPPGCWDRYRPPKDLRASEGPAAG